MCLSRNLIVLRTAIQTTMFNFWNWTEKCFIPDLLQLEQNQWAQYPHDGAVLWLCSAVLQLVFNQTFLKREIVLSDFFHASWYICRSWRHTVYYLVMELKPFWHIVSEEVIKVEIFKLECLNMSKCDDLIAVCWMWFAVVSVSTWGKQILQKRK